MCIDLIAPMFTGATFACWSCMQFSQISKEIPVMRLGLYTITIINTMLWADMAFQRFMGGKRC